MLHCWRNDGNEQSNKWISDSPRNSVEKGVKKYRPDMAAAFLQKVLGLQREILPSFLNCPFLPLSNQCLLRPHCGRHSTRNYIFDGEYIRAWAFCPHGAKRLVGDTGSGHMFRTYEKLWGRIAEESYFGLGQELANHSREAKSACSLFL